VVGLYGGTVLGLSFLLNWENSVAPQERGNFEVVNGALMTPMVPMRVVAIPPFQRIGGCTRQHSAGSGRCNADGEPLYQIKHGKAIVYLHAECERFWKAEQALNVAFNALGATREAPMSAFSSSPREDAWRS
jgi:hypothetical protein